MDLNEYIPRDAIRKAIRRVCPHLSEPERQAAEENFRRYLEIVLRIWERERRSDSDAKGNNTLTDDVT